MELETVVTKANHLLRIGGVKQISVTCSGKFTLWEKVLIGIKYWHIQKLEWTKIFVWT